MCFKESFWVVNHKKFMQNNYNISHDRVALISKSQLKMLQSNCLTYDVRKMMIRNFVIVLPIVSILSLIGAIC